MRVYGNVVGGMSLMFVYIVQIPTPLVADVFAVVLVVDMRLYDKTLCAIWWVRGDSVRSLPATVPFVCWAVKRGLWFCENDSRLACTKVTLAAHV